MKFSDLEALSAQELAFEQPIDGGTRTVSQPNYLDSITNPGSTINGVTNAVALNALRPSHLDCVTLAGSAINSLTHAAGLNLSQPSYFDSIANAGSAINSLTHATTLNLSQPSYFDSIANAGSVINSLTHAAGLNLSQPSYFDSIANAGSAINSLTHAAGLNALRLSYLDSSIGTAVITLANLHPSFLDSVTAAKSMLGLLHTGFDSLSPILPTRIVLSPHPQIKEETPGDPALIAFLELREIEHEIRSLITAAMLTMFGQSWIESRVPARLVKKWTNRRAESIADGENAVELMFYADFQDYRAILEHEDNWSVLFVTIFPDRDEIISSLHRLNAVRRPTMHARAITSELLRVLKAEIARLRRTTKKVIH
jgi:hypothetical protein